MTTGRRGVAVVLAAVAVALAVGASAAPAAPGAHAQAQAQPEFPSDGTALEWDETLMIVEVRPDGSASWRVEFRYRLDDGETEESFSAVRRDVERNPLNYTGQFAAEMQAAAAAARRDTGREMAIHNVTVNVTRRAIPEAHGVLVYTFVWEGFAAVADGGRLRGGGVLSGMILDERQALVVSWPSGYRLVDATPTPTAEREAEVVWRGPVVFGEAGPSVVVAPTDGGGRGGTGVPVVPVAGVLGVVALAVVAVALRRRRGGTAAGGEEPTPTADEELLSDEERVLRLLEDHGGRMKQQDVVEAVEWSETKTSEVVRTLREEDRIEVYRIGRENVLALPGEMDL